MRELDNRYRFLIETCNVRGQLVRLDETWKIACARTDYPEPVRHLLGEAFVATTLLAGTIKFEGKMTLQVRGDGPVTLLVVQITSDGKLRGLARWREEHVFDEQNDRGSSGDEGSSDDLSGDEVSGVDPSGDDGLTAMFGVEARMMITIEAKAYAEPYQAVVALEGDSLADALRAYFVSSEQLQTELYLSVSDETAAGMLLQKLPFDERQDDDTDGWRRASVLASTITGDELRTLPAVKLLGVLFHEEEVRLFDEASVCFSCSCSRERTDGMLLGLGGEEVADILEEQSAVEITCEFCDSRYVYDAIDVATLFKGTVGRDEPSPTVH